MMLGTADGGMRLFKMEAVSSLQCRSSLSEPKPRQSLWGPSPPPLGSPSCCSLTGHRSSEATPSERALYSPSPPSAPDMSTAPGHELVAGAQTGATGILHAIFGITHPSLSFPGGNVVSFPTARPRKILGATGAWLLPPPPPLYPVEPRLTVPRLRHGRLEGQGDFGAKGIRPLHGAHDSMKVPPCERKL